MYSHKNLQEGFQQIPLTPSRVIMVHSSFKSLGKVDGGAETVIDALLDWVGPDGTILFPNFNFQSWTENHYFDVLETPSQMGIIGELARLRPGAVRSPHPIYSFAVLGKLKKEWESCNDSEAYGPNSAFALFHKLKGLVVSIGLHWNSTFSMIHYCEYNSDVEYRRTKKFSGVYVGYNGEPEITTYSMYVRRNNKVMTDVVPAMDELYDAGVIKSKQVGDANVHYATAVDTFDKITAIAREEPGKLHKIKTHNF